MQSASPTTWRWTYPSPSEGFHQWGYPIMVGFSGKIALKWMMTGGTPIYGNPPYDSSCCESQLMWTNRRCPAKEAKANPKYVKIATADPKQSLASCWPSIPPSDVGYWESLVLHCPVGWVQDHPYIPCSSNNTRGLQGKDAEFYIDIWCCCFACVMPSP